jgi:hypothetical protein
MIRSVINNRQFWTASLKITVLVMILTVPVKVDQRQKNIVDQIIGDLNDIFE